MLSSCEYLSQSWCGGKKQVFDSRSVARAVGAGKVLLLCVGVFALFFVIKFVVRYHRAFVF